MQLVIANLRGSRSGAIVKPGVLWTVSRETGRVEMAYVGPPFAHDIFVSYSHGDDGSGQSFLQPWSAAFARELERELRADRRFRQQLKIFLDENQRPGQGIDPMAPLSDQLRKEIGAAAILLVRSEERRVGDEGRTRWSP